MYMHHHVSHFIRITQVGILLVKTYGTDVKRGNYSNKHNIRLIRWIKDDDENDMFLLSHVEIQSLASLQSHHRSLK